VVASLWNSVVCVGVVIGVGGDRDRHCRRFDCHLLLNREGRCRVIGRMTWCDYGYTGCVLSMSLVLPNSHCLSMSLATQLGWRGTVLRSLLVHSKNFKYDVGGGSITDGTCRNLKYSRDISVVLCFVSFGWTLWTL